MASPRSVQMTIAGVRAVVVPVLEALFKKTWSGQENLHQERGAIVVSNHLTEADPFVLGHFLVSEGYMPHFMAKDSLFTWPILGPILRSSNQVPVFRGSADAGKAIAVAQKLVREENSMLIIYPEGTLTKDPDLWPMRGYTGAARLALATGAEIVPVAHWGDHRIFPTPGKKIRFARRPDLLVRAGKPVALDDLRDKPVTKALLDEATERIMTALTHELAGLRGEEPPATRFDPRKLKK